MYGTISYCCYYYYCCYTIRYLIKVRKYVFDRSMMQIVYLTRTKIRPRCLIIHFFDSRINVEKFLRKMWMKLFLDVTVIDGKNTRIHQFNPFVGYAKTKLNRKTVLFPDKCRNMNRYQMKVGLFQSPPFAYVRRNSTHHPVEVSGKDVYLGEIFAERMNFQSILIYQRWRIILESFRSIKIGQQV